MNFTLFKRFYHIRNSCIKPYPTIIDFKILFSNCILLFNAISSLIFPYVYKNHRLYKPKYVTYDDFGAHVKKAILMLRVVTRGNEKTFFDNKLICSSMWVLFTILLSFLYHLYQVA